MYLSFICIILLTLRANIHSKYSASYKPLNQSILYEFSIFSVLYMFIMEIYFKILFSNCRTYPALETLTEPHQLTATLSCVIGVARSLVSGGRWFPEGPTHMLPLLMRALPGVDPNDFSKCMVSTLRILVCS